jgi:hypothetical protein
VRRESKEIKASVIVLLALTIFFSVLDCRASIFASYFKSGIPLFPMIQAKKPYRSHRIIPSIEIPPALFI